MTQQRDYREFSEITLSVVPGLRKELKSVVGQMFGSVKEASSALTGHHICVVGDETARNCIHAGIEPEIMVVDFRTKRSAKKNEYAETFLGLEGYRVIHARNPQGEITPELWSALETALWAVVGGGKALVVVDGEEDLASLPLILILPVGWVLMYGMPGMGLQILYIDEVIKDKTLKVLRRMKVKER